jgi:hypothetical protein
MGNYYYYGRQRCCKLLLSNILKWRAISPKHVQISIFSLNILLRPRKNSLSKKQTVKSKK